MWQLRTFRTKENMKKFLEKNQGKIQWNEVFINNGYAIEYRLLRKVY